MARVPLVGADAVEEQYRDHISEGGTDSGLWAAVGNNPGVMAAFDGCIEELDEVCGLSGREQELLILAVAGEVSSRYVWHHHVRFGRERGVSAAELRGLAHFDYEAFGAAEEALIRYGRAVVRGQVSDSDHRAMVDAYDTGAVVGAAVLAGVYLSVARVTQALGVEVGEEFVGWDPG